MKRLIVTILLVLSLVAIPAGTALAGSTTADVTVTATPQVLGIAMTSGNTTYDFGTVDVSTTPASTTSYLNVDNTSNIVTDVSVKVTSATWEGGDYDWTHADDATPGDQIVGLKANKGGTWGVSDVIVKANASFNLIADDQAATTDFAFGLKMWVPSAFNAADTGTQKTNTVRLTAAAAS